MMHMIHVYVGRGHCNDREDNTWIPDYQHNIFVDYQHAYATK